jgi:hypothetical protein
MNSIRSMARSAQAACGALTLLTLFALVSLVGCGDMAGMGGRPSSGSLGNTNVRPECGAFSQACLAQGLDAPLALGGITELSVDFTVNGSSGPPLALITSDTTILRQASGKSGSVEAVGVGAAAVLFVGPDKRVVDFLHLWVSEPDELRIQRYSSLGALLGQVQPAATLLVGDELLVSVEPYAGGQALLGNFTLERTLSGDAVAIVPDSIGGWYRVVARKPGKATLEFGALNKTARWEIEVLP